MLIGATVWGRMSDLFGRKYAYTLSLFMGGFFGLLCATSPDYEVRCSEHTRACGAVHIVMRSDAAQTFLAFRVLLSIGVGGAVPLSFTVFCEWSGKDNRGGYLTLLEAFWCGGWWRARVGPHEAARVGRWAP
jgi:MFS family permease